MTNMTQMYKAAIANREATGEAYGAHCVSLSNGGELICFIKPRQSNSRGVRRAGGYDATIWNYVAPGEQYSKQIAAEAAKNLLEEVGV
jgi:hypothetical protein